MFDRGNPEYGFKSAFFDLNWNNISEGNVKGKHAPNPSDSLPEKPKSLEKMLEYARILSEDFPEVRVDFYEINEEPIFGELTFTTGYDYWSDQFNKMMGDSLSLDKIPKKKFINRVSFMK